jgi:hypothetical protein
MLKRPITSRVMYALRPMLLAPLGWMAALEE